MKKATLACLLLAACTPQQVERAGTYHQQIARACDTAMLLAPLAPQIAPWIIGGCATADSISRLAMDPNSLEWVRSLIQKARAPQDGAPKN